MKKRIITEKQKAEIEEIIDHLEEAEMLATNFSVDHNGDYVSSQVEWEMNGVSHAIKELKKIKK